MTKNFLKIMYCFLSFIVAAIITECIIISPCSNAIADTFPLMIKNDGVQTAQGEVTQINPHPPNQTVRLIFIHHSTGENWLSDGNGGLGIALMNNNYFVSDTNYGWGPDHIGDTTDIGHWWRWFRGPKSSNYTNALYRESNQHSEYSRLPSTPQGENEIVMFKSCFPNSALQGNPYDPVPTIDNNPLKGESCGPDYHTVANAKGIYIDLLEYFRTRQDKLFIVITAPPLSDPTFADNARAFNNWLVHDWLKNYPYKNVAVFDFYNVLTTNGGNPNINDLSQEIGNHHRLWNNTVQHKTDGDNDSNPNILEYPSNGDDHPSQAGNQKATGEYLTLLNIFYNCWKGQGACPYYVPSPERTISISPASYDFGDIYAGDTSEQIFTISNTGTANIVIGTITISGDNSSEFLIQNDNCSGKTLSGSSSCTVSIVFSPVSQDSKNSVLTIPCSNGEAYMVYASLSGNGIVVQAPDLTGNWILLEQSCKTNKKGVQQCKIKGTFNIQNIGNRNANSSVVRYYLSDDDIYSEDDRFIKQVSTGKIKAGNAKRKTFSYSLPKGENASGRYVIAVIDVNDTITESEETNNNIPAAIP